MRYFKIVIYSGDGDYETKEKIIGEKTFRNIQKALIGGSDLLVLEDRVIKRSQIKEITPADNEVAEYRNEGLNVEKLLNISDIDKLKEGEKTELKNPELEKAFDEKNDENYLDKFKK